MAMNRKTTLSQGNNPLKNPPVYSRVLIVDDEPLICWSLQSALMNKGLEVFTAVSFKDGMREIYAHCFDVLIVDLKLDESDGFNVIISAQDKNPSIKTILITACGDENSRHKANEFGVDLFVEKPLILSEMVNSVSLLIKKKSSTNPN